MIANRILDLAKGVGQIACTWRWDLVNLSGGVLGQLHPAIGATMSNDTTGSIYRTVRDLRLQQGEWRDIDIFTSYVRPWMVLEDRTEWPQGLLAFSTNPITEGTLETSMSSTLVDLRFVLDQAMPFSYGLKNGALVFPAMVEVVELFGFADYAISDTGAQIGGGPVNWPPDATGLEILESLCQRAGFHPPYLDNSGVVTLRPPIELQLGQGHVYNRLDGRIRQGTMTYTTNLLTAPNTFKVISSGGGGNDISAEAYIDPSLPHSRENRGSRVPKVIRRQGLKDSASCLLVASSYARDSAAQYATREFDSVPDPRHDTFDIVETDGDPYREIAWTMVMAPGGSHSHRLVKDTVSYE